MMTISPRDKTVAFLDYPTIKEFWTPLPVMNSDPRTRQLNLVSQGDVRFQTYVVP